MQALKTNFKKMDNNPKNPSNLEKIRQCTNDSPGMIMGLFTAQFDCLIITGGNIRFRAYKFQRKKTIKAMQHFAV